MISSGALVTGIIIVHSENCLSTNQAHGMILREYNPFTLR